MGVMIFTKDQFRRMHSEILQLQNPVTCLGESVSTYWAKISLALAAIFSGGDCLKSLQALRNSMFSSLNSDLRKHVKTWRPSDAERSEKERGFNRWPSASGRQFQSERVCVDTPTAGF